MRTGLEPATPCVTGMYSNQLNYHTIIFVRRHPVCLSKTVQSYCLYPICATVAANIFTKNSSASICLCNSLCVRCIDGAGLPFRLPIVVFPSVFPSFFRAIYAGCAARNGVHSAPVSQVKCYFGRDGGREGRVRMGRVFGGASEGLRREYVFLTLIYCLWWDGWVWHYGVQQTG